MTTTTTAPERVRLPRPVEPVRLPPRAELVAWGREHGFDVPAHGRLPAEVHERYISYRLRTRRRLIRQAQDRHPTTHVPR